MTDAFVRDRQTGTTVMASVNDDESPVTTAAGGLALSGDGRSIAFCDATTEFAPGISFCSEVAVRHLDLGTTVRLPHLHDLPNVGFVRLSFDGTRAAYAHTTIGNGPSSLWCAVADTTTGAVVTDIGAATLETTGKAAVDLYLSGDGSTWALLESHNHFTGTPTGVVTVGRVDGTRPPVTHTYRWLDRVRLSNDGSVLAVKGLLTADAAFETVGIDHGTRPPSIVSADTHGNAVPAASTFELSADGQWVAFDTVANGALGGAHNDASTAVYTREVLPAATPPS